MADDNNKLIQCPTCNGSWTILGGWDRITGGRNLRCPVCIGTGKVERTYTDASHQTEQDDASPENLEDTDSDQEYEVNEEIVEEMRELGETRRAERDKASQHMEQFLKQEEAKEEARKEKGKRAKRRAKVRSTLAATFLISVIVVVFALLFYTAESRLFTLDSKTITLDVVEEEILTNPSATSLLPPTPTPLIALPMVQAVIIDTKTPTPTPTPVPPSIEELKLYALELINEDRKKHGVAPVILGINPAAQMHAEDSLKHEYSSHWYQNGEKPYMVYSRTGGDSYVSENSASGGWSEEERKEALCGLITKCLISYPKKHIEEMHYKMMYDDAHADWGHRDQILNPKHLKVNIGLAYDEGFMVTPWWKGFYHHFEGGHFVAGPPQLNGTELSIRVENVTKDYYFGRSTVQVYFDPPYTEMAIDELESLGGYCVGGGTNCELPQDDRLAASIIKPPQPGFSYSNLDPKYVVAQRWIFTNDYLEVTANLGDKIYDSGVYTVFVWGTHAETDEEDVLIGLSVVKR